MFQISSAIDRAQDAVKDFWTTGILPPRLAVGTASAYFKWIDTRESVCVYMDSKGRVQLVR